MIEKQYWCERSTKLKHRLQTTWSLTERLLSNDQYKRRVGSHLGHRLGCVSSRACSARVGLVFTFAVCVKSIIRVKMSNKCSANVNVGSGENIHPNQFANFVLDVDKRHLGLVRARTSYYLMRVKYTRSVSNRY